MLFYQQLSVEISNEWEFITKKCGSKAHIDASLSGSSLCSVGDDFVFVCYLATAWFNDSFLAPHSALRSHSAGDNFLSVRTLPFRWIMLFIYSNLHSFNSIALTHYVITFSNSVTLRISPCLNFLFRTLSIYFLDKNVCTVSKNTSTTS